MASLIFILEDQDSARAVFERRVRDIGCVAASYSTVSEAENGFAQSGDIYRAYFLDMKTPFELGGEPMYSAGLDMRRKLLDHGVEEGKIYLMSAGVSHNDELAAKEYGVDPGQIIAKDRFTEMMLCDLLGIKG